MWAPHIQVCWKPILAFTKRGCNRAPRMMDDVVRGSGTEKSRHQWQQAEDEAGWLIEKLTDVGDLVLDPFLGSGTVGAAAVRRGRFFLGCDVESGCVHEARQRLAAITAEAAAS